MSSCNFLKLALGVSLTVAGVVLFGYLPALAQTNEPPPLISSVVITSSAANSQPDDLMAAAEPAALLPAAPAVAPTPTFEDTLMEVVNQARWDNGNLPPLKRVSLLDTAAEGHSQRMAVGNFFAHCDPDTKTLPWDRMTNAGYIWNAAAENIAAGTVYNTSYEVMYHTGQYPGWMNSTGHRANILSSSFREIGVSYFHQANDEANVDLDSNSDCQRDPPPTPKRYFHYWTQNFGARDGTFPVRDRVYPVVINREAFLTDTRYVLLYVYGPTGATQMHFSNDNVVWTDWEPFANNKTWPLSLNSGQKMVYAQVKTNTTTYAITSDDIYLEPPAWPGVSIVNSPLVLGWAHTAGNQSYDVYRSATNPYLTSANGVPVGVDIPPPGTGTMLELEDTTPGTQFYLVTALGGDGVTEVTSNHVGRFVFPLTGG